MPFILLILHQKCHESGDRYFDRDRREDCDGSLRDRDSRNRTRDSGDSDREERRPKNSDDRQRRCRSHNCSRGHHHHEDYRLEEHYLPPCSDFERGLRYASLHASPMLQSYSAPMPQSFQTSHMMQQQLQHQIYYRGMF